ncbi:MAG: toll/interleukin-1 receptor domain-containing protein [Hydrogenophaga sp.]|uniref:toll/interleukin-1 receptor domain-containing protein n=1 Tax=Hydrogenophaga sp. TaxID=1904254 RepID=UPI001D4DFFB8|nr:toll/interleukin-1 receptor domain-containing protein [Hydrogenophaga sp.]MBX3611437.1 toll/interleukin-1 receptor domain-containing protein [Hydrogenophaga sp.]
MDGIFISYRRDDASGFAGRLYDRLASHFGAGRVFMDVEGIELGADFVQSIEAAVAACRVLIVVIGDEWLNTRDAAGRRRLEDPHDFIRLEVGAALKRNIRVVPVLVAGAVMPRAEELPQDMQGLARRQAIAVHHQQWEATTASLVQALEKLLGEGHGADGGGKRWAWGAMTAGLAGLAAAGWWAWREPPEGRVSEVPEGTLVAAVPATPPAAATPAESPTSPVNATAPTEVAAAASPTPSPAPAPAAVASVAAAPPPAPPATRPATAVIAAAPTPSATQVRPSLPAALSRAPAAPTPAPQRTTTASAAPSPPPSATASVPNPSTNDRLPRVGERWTYRFSGKWPSSPRRDVTIAVAELREDLVTDRLSDNAGTSELRRSRAGQAAFINWPSLGLEFSPYLATGDIGAWRGDSDVKTPWPDPQWTGWSSQAKLVGRESVTVPAGRFNAYKVEIWSNRMPTGGAATLTLEPIRVRTLVWYAPEARRYVRLQRQVHSAGGQEIDRDLLELVSHSGG